MNLKIRAAIELFGRILELFTKKDYSNTWIR